MNIAHLVSIMEQLAPLDFAEPWDRAGLLVGDPQRPLLGPALLAIDLTEPVLDEAIRLGAGAIVAYHPPIWEPLARLTTATPRQRIILRAVEKQLAVFSPHTALDAAPGGLTDWLCEGLAGMPASDKPQRIKGDVRALSPRGRLPGTQQVKIVTFVPEDRAEQLRQALATAGAGIIGRYRVCSFAAPGAGTFLGDEATNPAVGQPGRLEHAPELRLEMVCSRSALPLALETLRHFHPYEQPAVDVYELAPQPQRGIGPGRRLVLDQPITIGALARRIKAFLSTPARESTVRVATPAMDPAGLDHAVTHVGVCAGSGSELASLARAEGCQVFVTGEMKHHEVMNALNAGMSVILAGHTTTERGFLPRLARLMEEAGRPHHLKALVSQADREPLLRI
jgi:dinuclear metal center YbgI/SA1388 family protein